MLTLTISEHEFVGVTIREMLTILVVCTNLSDKEPYRQVNVDRVTTSGSLAGVMVSVLARNATYVSSIPAVCEIFPIFIIPITLGAVTWILYKVCTLWLVNLSNI